MAEQERRDTVPGGPDGGARDRVGDRDGEGAAADRLEADTAQLLEANRRLREAIQRRDELLALAAEDLRGPAAAVLRQLQRLREDVLRAPAADCQRALDALDRQARRVVSLADDLLVLRTIEGGQAQLHRRPVELGALVVGVVASRLPSFEAAGVELDRELPPYPLSLHADPDRLAEALGALLDAALGASTRGELVRLTVEASPEGARVTVDDGRATLAAGPRAPRGTGRRGGEGRLALAVCRRLAELHGGSLEIVPRGRGRTARLTLPAAGPADERAPARPHPSGARARLLVADDDGDAREALAMLLGDDYEVQLAADGQEAVESALVTRPDLVLLDLYMPRLDGLAALEALRADPLTADVPVILVSARGDELTRSRSLDLGAVDFLQKPFSGRELKARIERTLRLTRRETQLQELARTDPLTGLANLRAFRGRLEEEVKRARRYRTPLACVMVDMDHLKPINDELGHAAGDLALGALAEVIRRELRETDFGARYGGDEFVMLLPHTSADEARVLTERICARLREASPEVAGRRLALAASFGIAALGDEPIDELGETLVRRADAALYAAKRAGRGQVAAHPTPGGESAPAP